MEKIKEVQTGIDLVKYGLEELINPIMGVPAITNQFNKSRNKANDAIQNLISDRDD
ncbi:MAG: hypothetical protein ACRCVG_03945 [Methanobacteriaceae archaeon]